MFIVKMFHQEASVESIKLKWNKYTIFTVTQNLTKNDTINNRRACLSLQNLATLGVLNVNVFARIAPRSSTYPSPISKNILFCVVLIFIPDHAADQLVLVKN